jgi:hypothetical protein
MTWPRREMAARGRDMGRRLAAAAREGEGE